jgi:uncharacterized protein
MKAPMATALCPLHIEQANSWHQRLLGLMFRRTLRPGHGMLLTPCTSIHTAFMRFEIDVVYLDAEFRVLSVHTPLKPWRLSWGAVGTRHALELPAGTAQAMGWQTGQPIGPLLMCTAYGM